MNTLPQNPVELFAHYTAAKAAFEAVSVPMEVQATLIIKNVRKKDLNLYGNVSVDAIEFLSIDKDNCLVSCTINYSDGDSDSCQQYIFPSSWLYLTDRFELGTKMDIYFFNKKTKEKEEEALAAKALKEQEEATLRARKEKMDAMTSDPEYVAYKAFRDKYGV